MPLFGFSGRERDDFEITDLNERVANGQRRSGITRGSIAQPVIDRSVRALPEALRKPFTDFVYGLIDAEPYLSDVPSPHLSAMTLSEQAEYKHRLTSKLEFLRASDRYIELFRRGVTTLIDGIADQIPDPTGSSPFSIPLAYALPDAKEDMDSILNTLGEDKWNKDGLFRRTYKRLCANYWEASGLDPVNPPQNRKPVPAGASRLPLSEAIDTYLDDTPFCDLFKAPVPLRLSYADRFNHMHIIGGAGAGKTTLIENLIVHDIQSDNPPSLVIVDPHSDLIQKLLHSDLGIEDRLVYINPRDINFPPALNVFSVNQDRLGRYDEAMREQITASVIQTFDYLFAGLFSAELTAKQGVFFRYVARLLLTLPETLGRNATILDMLHLMGDATPYRSAIERLPPIARAFFEQDFPSKTFSQTKEQIRYRLQAIIENPTLARLFTSPKSKFDLFDELNRGSVILVDTAKDFLKSGSSIYGRIIISLVLQAVLERAAIPESRRKPTFLFVDEAASYFDSNIDDLLTDARKYRCGCVFSHQYLDQATGGLRASLAANTGIKFASGVSAGDARSMATEMRTTPDFILAQGRLEFAARIQGVTPSAVSIKVPYVKTPRLSESAVDRLIERNRRRVALAPGEGAAAPGFDTPRSAPQAPDEDISEKW